MDEKETQEFEQRMKDFLKSIYPNEATFLERLIPYFTLVDNEYVKFLEVLKKVGINSINEYINILFISPAEASWNLVGTMTQPLIKELEEYFKNAGNNLSLENALRTIGEKSSFEEMLPYTGEFRKVIKPNFDKHNELDKKVEALSPEEKAIYEYFNLLISKAWTYYMVKNPNFPHHALQEYMKEFLPKYYKSLNALYDKELVSPKLIAHIESIKIPKIEQIYIGSENVENILPVPPIHLTSEIEQVHEILKKYFDKSQYETLLRALKEGTVEIKLLFIGQGNQLVDVFRKLFIANLMTNCTKEELIEWLKNTFEYRSSRSKKITAYTETYLRGLISSNDKPCKNPIISIKKDDDGVIKITIPDKQERQPQ